MFPTPFFDDFKSVSSPYCNAHPPWFTPMLFDVFFDQGQVLRRRFTTMAARGNPLGFVSNVCPCLHRCFSLLAVGDFQLFTAIRVDRWVGIGGLVGLAAFKNIEAFQFGLREVHNRTVRCCIVGLYNGGHGRLLPGWGATGKATGKTVQFRWD